MLVEAWWHREDSSMAKWSAVKVFSATKSKEREDLGEKVTRWIASNPGVDIVEYAVRQSSDNEYHCITIVIFYNL